jgi:Fuc2NAc and GlcNAc transferase
MMLHGIWISGRVRSWSRPEMSAADLYGGHLGAVFALVALASSWIGTWAVLRYARRTGLLDVPNERSSHAIPTPRGGGIAVAAVIIVAGAVLAAMIPGAAVPLAALALAVAVLTALGWADDRSGISARVRLLVQVVVSVGFITAIGWPQQIDVFGLGLPLALAGAALAVLWLVWLTNLFNFMDGIDGIAGVQAMVAGVFFGLWFHAHGAQAEAIVSWVVAASATGFLAWNWQPARIFLGDAGSLALGFVLAALALCGVVRHGMPWGAFVLVLGPFIADASWTLLRRMLRREQWWRPHRSHFYQRAVLAGWEHRQVSASVLAASVLLGLLGTLEVALQEPRWVWPIVAAAVLAALAVTVKSRENKHFGDGSGQP